MEKAGGAVARDEGRMCGQETEKGSEKKADMEDDIRLLLDCLHFQHDCPSSQQQALTTMATMCAHSSQSRDLFRVTGALSYVLDLLYSTTSTCVQQAALYTLGCASEKNAINQMKLCDEKLFSFLADLLKPHPPTMPTQPASPALTASIAYMCGCLMSGNCQGQNMARNKRLLHTLITVFKSTLPKSAHGKPDEPGHSAAAKKPDSATSLQVWTSISSALCTANNNPQNELNQCVCSQLLPAALSLIGGASPLQPDVLRPAVSFISSCVANNGTTQGRLRMIGGLHILVSALKELSSSEQSNELTSRVLLTDLAVHIVQALSAAIFMHATNTETVCDSGVVRHLLGILQWEGLDGHAQLSIVMCLSMLTEDRVSTQSELISCGGLHVLLSLLSVAGHSDEELSKAITFVLQCCLPQQRQHQQQECDANNVGDEAVRAGIARVERLLTQANNDSNNPPPPPPAASENNAAEDKELHDFSTVSSNQSLTSAHALRLATTTLKPDPSQKHPINLEHLDKERLPIQTTIANWLINADSAKSDDTTEENVDSQLSVGGACNLATVTTKHRVMTTKEIMKSKNRRDLNDAILDSAKDCEGIAIEEQCDDSQKKEADVCSEQCMESESLLKERKLRQELERALERERVKRKRLERLVKRARQVEEPNLVEQDKQDKESETHFEANQDRGCLIECQSNVSERDDQKKDSQTSNDVNQDRGHLMKRQSKAVQHDETLGNKYVVNEGKGHLNSHQVTIKSSSNSMKVQKSQPHCKPTSSILDDNKENMDPLANSHTQARPAGLKSVSAINATPVNAAKPSNIRYANSTCSTNVHQKKSNLKAVGYGRVKDAPKTCSYVSVATKMSQQVMKGKLHGIKGAAVEKGRSCKQLSHASSKEGSNEVIMKGALMKKGQHSCQPIAEKLLVVTKHQRLSKIDEECAPTHQPDPPTATQNAEISSNGDRRQKKLSTVNEEDAATHQQRYTFTTMETTDLNKQFQSASTAHQCMDQHRTTETHSNDLLAAQQQNLAQYKAPHTGLSSSCEHQCLACKPRLKCATVNSRNFVRMIQFDRFTCAYHSSVIQRLATATNMKRSSEKGDDMCSVSVREVEKKGDHNNLAEGENLTSQPDQQVLLESSGVCMSLYKQGDTVCADKPLSCMCSGGVYASQTVSKDSSQQNLSSELYRSKQSDRLLKRKTPSQCSGSSACASTNMHSGSESHGVDDLMNVGGHCFCTNAATPVKKQRMDEVCKGHGGHIQETENECLVPCDDSGSFSESDDTAQNLQYLNKQCPLHYSSNTNNQSDYRSFPSKNQPKTTQPMEESSSSSSADSAIQHPPEHQNHDDSSSQSSEVSDISHSSDPSWTLPSQNSSLTTDSSPYSTAGDRSESKIAKKYVRPGALQDVQRNTEKPVQRREIESQSTSMQAAEKLKSDLAPDPQQLQRMRPHAQYHLVAQPTKGKKVTSSKASSTFGALIDVTNRGMGVGGAKGEKGRKRQPTSSTTTSALTVFDYGHGTPAKPVGSRGRSNATGQLHSGVVSASRKPRVPWSKSEEENLLKGVDRLGHRWSHILSAYQFHHSRDSTSLRDKYRNIQKYN